MARLEELETFVRVVESGSISGAAERLGVAKSAVSRRISDLEGRLGVQLFRRTTRSLNLTDSALPFYERCIRILTEVEEAEQSLTSAHGALQGQLRVAAPLSFGLLHLGPAIAEFAALHPGIHFDLDFNDRQVDLLAEGFDLALRIAQLADSSLKARQLAPIRLITCASPDYIQRRGTPLHPGELAEHDCLSYSLSSDPQRWSYLDDRGKPLVVRVPSTLQANNGDFLMQMALAGQGITRQPSFLLYKALRQGALVPLLGAYSSPPLHAHALYPGTRHLSLRVRAFVDFLASRFEGIPYWDAEGAQENGAKEE